MSPSKTGETNSPSFGGGCAPESTPSVCTGPRVGFNSSPSVSFTAVKIPARVSKDAILRIVSTKECNEAHMDRPAVLHAYDARDITHELYNSEQKSDRDRADMTVRFAIPTIADSHVFVGARSRLDVYSLLNSGDHVQK